jgi:hypothetical protein
MDSKQRLLLPPMLLIIASLACNAPFAATGTPQAAATANTFLTAAAQTIQAATTQTIPSLAPSATKTALTPTRLPPTLIPSNTSAPIVLCDAATFIKDVTIPDGTIIGRSATFTKTWRIQNTGTCSWTTSYALVFVNGYQMTGSSGIAMPSVVNPGQIIDLSITMTAPATDGHYQGFWKLRNAAGVLFGIGPQGQGAFWTDINVAGPIYTAYDFAASYCDATWDNTINNLPCPGANGDVNGFVLKLDHPAMETGQIMDQPGLLTVPYDANNGIIRGKYPAFNVQTGDHFQSLVNCQYKAYSCNVIFRLDYKIGSDDIKTLSQWNEVYEGEYFPVDIDLSALAGQSVRFILTVTTNGPSNQDYAIWFAPHIVRAGTPPTATSTFTPTNTPTLAPTLTPTSTSTPTSTPTP